MARFSIWLFFFMILMVSYASCWMFGNTENLKQDSDTNSATKERSAEEMPSRRIPFELKIMDDHFLRDAMVVRNMSPQDICHHQVVAELEGTCGDMSEEEIAKLSVRLLNCQSDAEKRRTYVCTSDMTIAECTRDMDGTTWNAYQIVMNRAKAICYAVRQQQFRSSAELTVNKLVESSQMQLESLSMLYEGQEHIRSVAESTIQQMESGHERLLESQAELQKMNDDAKMEVVDSLRELRQEKELLAASNKELLGVSSEIREKLDQTAEEVLLQSTLHSAHHQELIADLTNLGARAEDVSSKLDRSAAAAESFRLTIMSHHLTALNNLERINSTVNYLLSMADGFRMSMDSKLEWLLHLSGQTTDKVSVLSTILTHFVYFVSWITIFSLLNISAYVRCLFMCTICINATLEVRGGRSLTFMQLTIAISVMVLGDFIWPLLRHVWLGNKLKTKKPPGSDHELSTIDLQNILKACEILKEDFNSSRSPALGSLPALAFPPELSHSNSLNDQTGASCSFSDSCHSPPPIQRHALFLRPTPKLYNPPPSPSIFRESFACDRVSRRSSFSSRVGTPGIDSSPALSSMSMSCTSTPVKRRRSKSRNSSLNLSFSRPLCESLTKTGQPCKLQCKEGSSFCHHHQSD